MRLVGAQNRWCAVLALLALQTASLTLGWTFAAAPGFAQEEPSVNIKADFFRYDRATHVLSAHGNGVLSIRDVLIYSDALVANLDTGEMLAQGRVRLDVNGQSVSSDALTYNVSTRSGSLINAKADYTGPLVLGAVHLRAERMEGEPGTFGTATNSLATTCDQPNPVFYITAEAISVFVHDKIVGHNVSVWVGGHELFTLPYFVISLQDRKEIQLTPVVGHNDVEGYFVKSSQAYFADEHFSGVVHDDWMERLGHGTGAEYTYDFGEGRGTASVYQIENRQTSGVDLETVVNHTQALGSDMQARVYLDYLSQTFAAQPALSNMFTSLDISRVTPGATTFLSSTWSNNSVGPTSFVFSRLAHFQAFSPQFSGQFVTDFIYNNGMAETAEELFPRVTLQYLGSGYTASLITEGRWELGGAQAPVNPQFSLERLPELRVASSPNFIEGTWLIWQLEGSLGRFRESTLTSVDSGRADLTASVAGPIRIGEGALGVRAFARETSYTTGDTRFFYGGQLNYTLPLSDALEVKVGYINQILQGGSPFAFDQIPNAINAADVDVSYRTAQVSLDVTGSYDIQRQQLGEMLVKAIYLPQPDWIIGLAAGYNLSMGIVDQAEVELVLPLSKEWRLEYVGEFNGLTHSLTNDRISVTRIFCECLAVSLSYERASNGIWLETWLTAVPWDRGRFGVGDQGNLLFDRSLPFLSH